MAITLFMHDTKDKAYGQILLLRGKNDKDENAQHVSLSVEDEIIASGSVVETEKGVYEIYDVFVKGQYRANRLGRWIVK